MTRCPCAVCTADRAVHGFVAFLVLLAIAGALLGVFGCITAPTARGVARELDRCLSFRARSTLPLRCECVADADAECASNGLGPRCYADGWVDADRDGWTLAACRERSP